MVALTAWAATPEKKVALPKKRGNSSETSKNQQTLKEQNTTQAGSKQMTKAKQEYATCDFKTEKTPNLNMFTLPPILMVHWKMGVSPIFVLFH